MHVFETIQKRLVADGDTGSPNDFGGSCMLCLDVSFGARLSVDAEMTVCRGDRRSLDRLGRDRLCRGLMWGGF